MITLILVMCFSAVVCTLLVILLIRSNQDSTTRDQRLVTMMTTTMETLIQTSSTTSQKISSDLATVVEKVAADTNQTMTNLFLGREEQQAALLDQQNEPNEKQPVKGIETFDGLPSAMVEALQREDKDLERLTAPEWTVVSPPPRRGYGQTSEEARAVIQDAWTLDDQ